MIKHARFFIRKALRDQSGQMLPLLAAGLLGLLGIAGMSVDLGHAYVIHNELVASTNAAAMAAAQGIYVSGSSFDPASIVKTWGSGKGGSNYGGLSSASAVVKPVCLSSLLPKGTSSCSSASGVNAVRVTQTANSDTYFLKALGFKSIPVSATSTAALQLTPWNVAVVVDATGSMNDADSNCPGSTSKFQCAMNGLETLMRAADPCPPGAASCDDSTAIFRISLFAFPNISTSTVANAISCGGSLGYDMYTLPVTNGSSYDSITYQSGSGKSQTSWSATYQITGFKSDYYNPTSSNGLNSSSDLVKAVSGCMAPIKSAGTGTGALKGASKGGITYFAGAIYAAQAALQQAQQAHPGSQNAIILLSDGQANLVSSTGDFPTAYTAQNPATAYSKLTGTGLYPDATDECQQAILAAHAATVSGTRVYGVAYGSGQSGCTTSTGGTDSSLIAGSGNLNLNTPVSVATLTPCVTMEDIASAETYFYSDYSQTGTLSTCQSQSNQISSLSDIFGDIVSSFARPILVPNSAT